MTNPITLRTELEGLVQKWLDTALHFSADGSYLAASAMRACADELSAILSRATPSAAGVVTDALVLEWRDGCPEKFYAEEWFVAKTIHGDRVVLKALPEEYSYDFTTADGTYMKKANVKQWMQFPDSEYKAPEPKSAALETLQGGVVTDGWVLVPRVMTDAMEHAWNNLPANWTSTTSNRYRHMLTAAPSPKET